MCLSFSRLPPSFSLSSADKMQFQLLFGGSLAWSQRMLLSRPFHTPANLKAFLFPPACVLFKPARIKVLDAAGQTNFLALCSLSTSKEEWEEERFCAECARKSQKRERLECKSMWRIFWTHSMVNKCQIEQMLFPARAKLIFGARTLSPGSHALAVNSEIDRCRSFASTVRRREMTTRSQFTC